jgi:hypothetical protein
LSEAAESSADEQTTGAIDLSAELPEIADWLPESLQPAWDLIVALPIVGGMVIAVVFYLAAFAFRGLVLNTISRLASRTDTHLDNTIISHLSRPVFNTILYFGLILAVNVAALPFGRVVLINLFASVIVVSWMSAALRISNALLEAFSLDPRVTVVEPRTIPMFDLVLKLTIILVASYCLLMVWGINPIGWLASGSPLASPPKTRSPTCSRDFSSLPMPRTNWATTSTSIPENAARSPPSACAAPAC